MKCRSRVKHVSTPVLRRALPSCRTALRVTRRDASPAVCVPPVPHKMPDVMEVVLSGPAIKLFTKALTSLAKIGATLP